MSTQHNVQFYAGVLAGLTAGISSGLHNAIIGSYQNQQPHSWSLLTLYTGICGLFISLLTPLFDEEQRIVSPLITEISTGDWLKLSSVGIAALLGYCVKIKALQITDPTVVSCIRASEIVMAFTLEITALGQTPSMVEVAGSVLVVVSILCIAGERPGAEKAS